MEEAEQGSGRPRGRWLIIAAIAIAALIALLARRRLRDGSRRASGVIEVATRIGQRRSVRLEDGTRVELSVGSRLRYPSTFPAASRPVTLAGEGFFVVANDTARAFVVTAGPAVVETSSAAFAVRAYPPEDAARVVVERGTVRIAPAAPNAGVAQVLDAHTLARVSASGAIARTNSVDPAAYLGWRRGRIVLDDVPLRSALVELARWQNVDLRIGDSVVANRRVTATFASHQTLTEILDGIALQLGATYERDGRTVTFRRAR